MVALGQADTARPQSISSETSAPWTDRTLGEIGRAWDDIQATIQVRTPDRALDIMLNGWLVYQTLACRPGRGRRSTRRAARTDSATSSRT